MAPSRSLNSTARAILDSVVSRNIKSRGSGLDDLILLLDKKNKQSALELRDIDYHEIFETIFKLTLSEKQAALSAPKSNASSRLEKSAKALRAAVEHGAGKFKKKTTLALVDHITQTLPGPDGGFVAPLLQDYVKALVALLSQAVTVEQLAKGSADGWYVCVDFCADAISRYLDTQGKASSLALRASPAPGTPSQHVHSTRSNLSQSKHAHISITSAAVQDLVECVFYLVSAPHAPIGSNPKQLSLPLLQVLQLRHLTLGRTQQFAFSALIVVIQNIQADHTEPATLLSRDLVPLISHWWQAQKVAKDEMLKSVRDELLKAVFATQLHLEHLARSDFDDLMRKDMEDLLDTLWSEYSRRSEPDKLTLDDLDLVSSLVPKDYFRTAMFSLHTHTKEGERKWAMLQCLAILEAIFWKGNTCAKSSESEEQPRKRRRTAVEVNRLHRRLKSSDAGVQLGALQLIPFLVHEPIFDDDLVTILSTLTSLILTSDKRGTTASWAMVAAASCSLHKDASSEDLVSTWTQVWQFAARAISLPGTTRAACFLLHALLKADLVAYHSISEDITKIITTADVNGPAALMDSSVSLMLQLLHLRNSRLPNASQTTCQHVIRWIFLRWNPAELTYSSTLSPHVIPFDVINLVRSCCGAALLPHPPTAQIHGGPLSQAWKLSWETSTVTRYLLLLDESELFPASLATNGSEAMTSLHLVDQDNYFNSKKLVLELLFPRLEELQELCSSWSKRTADGGQQISLERLLSLFNFCLCTAIILPLVDDLNLRQSRGFEPLLLKLVDETISVVLDALESEEFLDALVRLGRCFMPRFATQELKQLAMETKALLGVFSRLSKAIETHSSRQSSGPSEDFMELDHEFESQTSRSSATAKVVDIPRSTISMSLDSGAFYLDSVLRLIFLEALSNDVSQVGLIPPAFLNHLLSLSDDEFLLCRSIVMDLFASDFVISPSNAASLVEKTGGIIGNSRFECCEVALSTCLDIISGLLPIWCEDKHEISAMVGDLYHHFVKNALPNNQLSPNVQISLARLIFGILKRNPQYGESLGLPSCRSTLLTIEKGGTLGVKFFIGDHLADMFGIYILKLHDKVFVDVLSNLPSSAEHMEGIAYRLFALSSLACRWPTLLRRSVYHIFETPGNIPESTKYATRCLSRISRALNLSSPQELFALFAPQLLYTWFSVNSIDEIPYSIFGFQSLKDLLRASQAEASALLIMRGQDMEFQELASSFMKQAPAVVEENFSRILAYTIAHGIAKPRAKGADARQSAESSSEVVVKATRKNSIESPGETRLRKLLGNRNFIESVYRHFADTVAILLDLFDQEDPIEDSFVGNLEYASKIMAEIKRYSHSDVVLPPNQQPVFKGRHLIRQLLYLCNLTPKYDFFSLWTPTLVAFVARRLVNTVHPALGSLHACSVLRKVRVLICLAGPAALEPYPLEMLLHSLRSFLVDSECADDAFGVSQYLITRGAQHLSNVPSFLAGYSLSTLASLRVFLESSQSSTTQESQFRATMGKARGFHNWFGKYLSNYDSPCFQDDNQREAFKSITQSAANIHSSGNAEEGSHESKLLLEILRDGDYEGRLLDESARDLALGLLCGDFKLPDSTSLDIVQSDEHAERLGAAVWKSCKTNSLSHQYLTWAGRVVGRAFVSSGDTPPELLQESRLLRYRKIAPGHHGSERGILFLLRNMTMAKESFTAGLAESALRSIVSEAIVKQDDIVNAACQEALPEALYSASNWGECYQPPSEAKSPPPPQRLHPDERAFSPEQIETPEWVQELTVSLSRSCQTEPDKSDTGAEQSNILPILVPILQNVKGFAEESFPFLIHLVLVSQIDQHQVLKTKLSESIKTWLENTGPAATDNLKLIINSLLYLRTQKYPNEISIADRSRWLDVDYILVAAAASRCGMYKSALLFTESAPTQHSRSSKRSTSSWEVDFSDLLLSIYENIDDPDAYYGLPQNSSLSQVLARLEYEKDGTKSLAFRGAQYDSHIRQRNPAANLDAQCLVNALGTLGLAGLSNSLIQSQQGLAEDSSTLESTFDTARRLEIWNLPAPVSSANHAAIVYKAFQAVHQAGDLAAARTAVHDGLGTTMRHLSLQTFNTSNLRYNLRAMAVLTELDDLLNIAGLSDLDRMLKQHEIRINWMRRGRYDDVSYILSCRRTAFSMLSQHRLFRGAASISAADTRQAEIRSMLMAASIYRFHKATQESLNLSTALTDLITPSEGLGLVVDASIRMEAANSLWDYGEMIPSIGMLQAVDRDSSLKKQSVSVSRSDLLSKIGYRVSVARLEKPQDIQKKYLEPALKELKGRTEGQDAGQVFHQFAMFCDEQLQNTDGLEDLARLQNLRKGKSDEVKQLKSLISSAKESQAKTRYSNHLVRAKQWLDLDEQELRRVEQTRSEFVRLSLENYLLSLTASDTHNNDALRFTAMWLENSDDASTNDAVKRYLSKVPTRKFATLMNQLTSRLQDQDTSFQTLLFNLVINICVEHPYHGMYHIWSGTKARTNSKDEVAVSRHKATERVAKQLSTTSSVATVWQAIDKTSKYYHALAIDRNPDRYKAGMKLTLKTCPAGQHLISYLAKYHIPPPTMQLELAADKDYSRVPFIAKLEPQMTIASGVSAPKIITAVGTDGIAYKQLVKGGNDDLRQDAIMEQVFAAVSSLLKLHRATQQRNLGIRTYKVLPLTASSGLIEFVPNTIPLHEFLMPAHERYYPKDHKGSQCRREISAVQNKSIEARVTTYRKVTSNFHPVMRYFFMEYFSDPDEWFARRLAYTRTTAAISMLGHVLGLGDRHGHNILLDSMTGEVVHIDLGVAFEMGRVLPVPELVPFRLTRDIVDGMGITKTEGVFRRCCEYTLDALREETYSIMTILDVLRYDPLYSWSISPVRLAKLQSSRQDGEGGGDGDLPDEEEADKARRRGARTNEPSEADRALEVVRKKLSKTLSVTATVNDLINQAADEKNLAVLYSDSNLVISTFSPHSLPKFTQTSDSPPASFSHSLRQGKRTGEPSKSASPQLLSMPPFSNPQDGSPRTTSTRIDQSSRGAPPAVPPPSTSFASAPPASGLHALPDPAAGANSFFSSPNTTGPSRRRPRVNSELAPVSGNLFAPSSSKPSPKRHKADAPLPGHDMIRSAIIRAGSGPETIDLTGAAFKPHAGARKLVIKNQVNSTTRQESVKCYYSQIWADLDRLLDIIFAGSGVSMPLERLYRGVEDICRRGSQAELYQMLDKRCEKHLNGTVAASISKARDGEADNVGVLAVVAAEWKRWNDQSKLIRSIFSYLDRTYLLSGKHGSRINDLTITLFKNMLFPKYQQASKTGDSPTPHARPNRPAISLMTLQGITDLLDLDRTGKSDESGPSLLKNSVSMMKVFGLYHKLLEPQIVLASTRYFTQLGEALSSSRLKDYVLTCRDILDRENHRCDAYNLDSTTKREVLRVAHDVLIEQYAEKLLDEEGVWRLLDEQEIPSLQALYQLLQLSGIHKKLRAPWGQYIKTTGQRIVIDKERGDEMIVRLLELRRSLDLIVRDSFGKDEEFVYSLRDAFSHFMNDVTIGRHWATGTAKIGEMIAKHVDMLLRGGLKSLPKSLLSDTKDRIEAEQSGKSSTADEDGELDRQLDQSLELFRFIQGKDAFEAFYKRDLARRLLMDRSASQDAERSMLAKLRSECGSNFTHNLEQMFRDKDITKDEMNTFRQWRRPSGGAGVAHDSDSEAANNAGGIDLHVMILFAAAWPTYPDIRVNLPSVLASQVDRFNAYYQTKHTGRILTWKHSLAHCVVRARFNRGIKELHVSGFQAIILLLFNEDLPNDHLTLDQIAEATSLPEDELKRTLQSLACGKFRVLTKRPKGRDIGANDTFSVNLTFWDPKFKIKINQIQMRETKEENSATHERIMRDRRLETQAAIVRIMKSRKTMTHALLVAEVINMTKSRGAVDASAIKKEIESLIEKDYLEREDNAYVYLA